MCDTFVVVRDARVILGKNSDRDPNEAQVLDWVPSREHAPGAVVECTWRAIPQARQTHALILSRPYWSWGAEMGANEHGVAIGNEAIFARAPFAEDGLTGPDLVRLGLERAHSAAEAVEWLQRLVRDHGQGGRAGYERAGFRYHNSFLIADRREAWLLECVGRDSEAERITSGVRTISNAISLAALESRARRSLERIAAARARRERTACLAAGVIDAADAARVLCDHGEGVGTVPDYRLLNGAMRGPCVHAGGVLAASQTTGSWISELSPGGDRHWASGTSAPCLGVFRPVTFERPRDTGRPTGSQDAASLWWRHESLHRAVLRGGLRLPASFRSDRERTQAAIFAGGEEGWYLADDWLSRWERYVPGGHKDPRPWWLRRYWRQVEASSRRGALLPWRDPA